jgi:hypothetical protein
MSKLELTVTEGQVTSFLGEEFESFIEDSQSPDPTYGLGNYACHILGLQSRMRNWWIVPVPDEIKAYLDEIRKALGKFERTLQCITYPPYSRNRAQELKEHYQSLEKITQIYNEGEELRQKYPINEENQDINFQLDFSNKHLKKQIILSNILFDPNKRDWKFQRLMWGNPNELEKYLDSQN